MPIEIEEIEEPRRPGDVPPPRPPGVGPTPDGRLPRLLVDGDERPDLDAVLLELHVARPLDAVGRCEVRVQAAVAGREATPPPPTALELGTALAVDLPGDRDHQRSFTGHVVGVHLQCPSDRPSELTFVAEDGLRALRAAPRTRTYDDLGDHEIIEMVLAEHGLQADIQGAGRRHTQLVQADQNDLEFLRERMQALDARLCMRGDVVEVRPRTSIGTADTTLELHSGQHLLDVDLRADVVDQYRSVQVTGWSVEEARTVAGRATALDLDHAGRTERTAIGVLEAMGDARSFTRSRSMVRTDEDAVAVARSELRRRARGFVNGHVVVTGDPRLVPGGHVRLVGIDARFVGTYEVVAVEHAHRSTTGYRTRLELCRPTITEVHG